MMSLLASPGMPRLVCGPCFVHNDWTVSSLFLQSNIMFKHQRVGILDLALLFDMARSSRTKCPVNRVYIHWFLFFRACASPMQCFRVFYKNPVY
jgi:hypothetical protein